VVVREQSGGTTCRLVEIDGRTHHISERYWFGWEVGERHRGGASEPRCTTFVSLVSIICRRMHRKQPVERRRSPVRSSLAGDCSYRSCPENALIVMRRADPPRRLEDHRRVLALTQSPCSLIGLHR
jgi:hypothetical protein